MIAKPYIGTLGRDKLIALYNGVLYPVARPDFIISPYRVRFFKTAYSYKICAEPLTGVYKTAV